MYNICHTLPMSVSCQRWSGTYGATVASMSRTSAAVSSAQASSYTTWPIVGVCGAGGGGSACSRSSRVKVGSPRSGDALPKEVEVQRRGGGEGENTGCGVTLLQGG
jgi:hypothetical protein